MNTKTALRATATELLNRQTALLEKQDSISKYGKRHPLLTTEEINTLDSLEFELSLLGIEINTFLADRAARKNLLKFLKRNIFQNN